MKFMRRLRWLSKSSDRHVAVVHGYMDSPDIFRKQPLATQRSYAEGASVAEYINDGKNR